MHIRKPSLAPASTVVASALASVLLTGCGGGFDAVVVASPSASSSPFLFWTGSSGGDHVIDGLAHHFAFRSETGCLYNFQTGQDNSAFCLISGGNTVTYGAFQGRVTNVLITDGTCHAAIIDAYTGNFSDIEVDAYGREVVLTTGLHPVLCT